MKSLSLQPNTYNLKPNTYSLPSPLAVKYLTKWYELRLSSDECLAQARKNVSKVVRKRKKECL